MPLKKKILFVSILSVVFFSCVKQVNVVRRNEPPLLVVEGNITTDTTPYTVKLTYSGLVEHADNIPDQYLEKNARVTISDDQGKSTPLIYTSQGIYTTTDSTYIGQVGKSYTVTVILKDGTKYISTPEKMRAPVKIDSIGVQYNGYFDIYVPKSMVVSVTTKDPAGEDNYYRWTFNSWVGRETKGVGCGIGCIMLQYCYQQIINKDIMLLSDASIDGNLIKSQKVGACYIYTSFNPFIDIGQISLTKEAYQFWESYRDQQTRSGSTLDPLPAAIKGNVHNAADADDVTLGYFSAAAVTHRKAVLIPYSITPYLLQISASQFIPAPYIACYDAFENTLHYGLPPARQYPPPPGWENAEAIKVYW